MVLNDDNTIVITSNRLAETGAPLLEQGMIVGQLSLADALIIGNCNNQVKFSELTVDMFRMLQALEREPMNLASQMNKPGIQEPADKPTRRENPHKYLLYKPTFSQLYTFLAASFKVLMTLEVYLLIVTGTLSMEMLSTSEISLTRKCTAFILEISIHSQGNPCSSLWTPPIVLPTRILQICLDSHSSAFFLPRHIQKLCKISLSEVASSRSF